MRYKYLLTAEHPFLASVRRRCLSLPEVQNVQNGLEAVGFTTEISEIQTNDSFILNAKTVTRKESSSSTNIQSVSKTKQG